MHEKVLNIGGSHEILMFSITIIDLFSFIWPGEWSLNFENILTGHRDMKLFVFDLRHLILSNLGVFGPNLAKMDEKHTLTIDIFQIRCYNYC